MILGRIPGFSHKVTPVVWPPMHARQAYPQSMQLHNSINQSNCKQPSYQQRHPLQINFSHRLLRRIFKEQKRETPHRTPRRLQPIKVPHHIEKGSNKHIGPQRDIIYCTVAFYNGCCRQMRNWCSENFKIFNNAQDSTQGEHHPQRNYTWLAGQGLLI